MSLLLYFLNAALLIGLMVWLRKQEWAASIKPYFIPALLIKLICGILLGLIYQYYYKAGDTLTYFNESLQLTAYAKDNPEAYARLILFNEFESEQFRSTIMFSRFPGFSNSFFMLKVTSLLNLLTGSSYYLNALYLSIFSFWGMTKLAAVLSEVHPGTKQAAVLAFLFFPSVVFWSSGLLKDAVMMGAICWVTAFILQLAHKQQIKLIELMLLPLMLYLFIRIKIFFSAATLLFFGSYLLVKLAGHAKPVLQKKRWQVVLYFAILVIAATAGIQVVSVYRIDFIVEQLVKTYEGMQALSTHVAHIEYPNLEPTVWSVLLHSPLAFFNSIFRPFIGESGTLLYVVAGLENLLILVLFVLAVASTFSKRAKYKFHLFHLASVLFILLTAVVIGISTPNFGTLIRYRIVFLPFLVYLLLQSHYTQKLLQKLSQ